MTRGRGLIAVSAYGRHDDEWDVLVRAGKQFLRERALMERDTSYTEMSVTLARRTGYPAFDFSEQAERAAMGKFAGPDGTCQGIEASGS
ncbi:MAG: hypothetical protein WA890_01450 [Micromonospora sp.]